MAAHRSASGWFDRLSVAILPIAFVTLAVAEWVRPLRHRRTPRDTRWPANMGAGALAGSVERLLVVGAVAAVARHCEARRFGLLRWLPAPRGMRSLVGVLVLDWTMYVWHRALHGVPLLWKLHAYHHRDAELDVTTAMRLDAREIVLSLPYRCLTTAALGIDARAALAYELVMQAAALFHHANVRLPRPLERALAHGIMTPPLHALHHALSRGALGSNLAIVLSVWDHVHGTHRRGLPADEPWVGVGLLPADDPAISGGPPSVMQ